MTNAMQAAGRRAADGNDISHSPGYGEWADFELPDDRSGWHPHCCAFYDYWLRISPLGRLPGRQHVSPFEFVPLLPRVWMLDVVRDPLRLRYRLVGTGEVRTLGRELTGQWVDEAHPEFRANASLQARYRYMAECGRPTWRRGPARWRQELRYLTVENCIVPLARDGVNVDILFAFSMTFFTDGRQVQV
jgi:hypothetical protein